MTKSPRKGNREAKKPKQQKTSPTATVGTPWTTIEKIKAQDRDRK